VERLSVVITAKNEEKNVKRLLDSLVPHSSNCEIIFVDGGSTDSTKEMVSSYSFVDLIDGTGSSRGGGRNIGIKKAEGTAYAFIDCDTEVESIWYKEAIESLKHCDVIFGRSDDPSGKTLPRVSIIYNGQDISYPSCNMVVKKSVLDKVGLFDENMVTAEDIDLNYRIVKAGYKLSYNPHMRIYHYHRVTVVGFLRQAFWNGYGRKQLVDKNIDLKNDTLKGFSLLSIARLALGGLGYLFGGYLR